MIKIDETKCIGCGKCVKDCPADRIALENKKAVCLGDCIKCGHCVAICPVCAVSIPQYDMADIETYSPETFSLDPDTLLRSIKFRRSIRDYKDQPVEQEKLDRIVQAGRYTATAKNNQDCHFVFVKDEMDKLKELVWGHIDNLVKPSGEKLSRELLPFVVFNKRRKANPADDYLFRNAPIVVFVTSEWLIDAGLAAQNMELMAHAEGLGMLYNGYLARMADMNVELKKWLGIEGRTIKACMLLGYPNVKYERTAPRAEANIIWR